jgi:hypothetical protein
MAPNGNLYLINEGELLLANRSLGLPGFPSFDFDPGATVRNIGNEPLVWTDTNKLFTESGNGVGVFTITPDSQGGCDAGTVLIPGAFCNLSVNFTPPGPGTFTDTLHFLTNAVNNNTTILKLAASH